MARGWEELVWRFHMQGIAASMLTGPALAEMVHQQPCALSRTFTTHNAEACCVALYHLPAATVLPHHRRPPPSSSSTQAGRRLAAAWMGAAQCTAAAAAVLTRRRWWN